MRKIFLLLLQFLIFTIGIFLLLSSILNLLEVGKSEGINIPVPYQDTPKSNYLIPFSLGVVYVGYASYLFMRRNQKVSFWFIAFAILMVSPLFLILFGLLIGIFGVNMTQGI